MPTCGDRVRLVNGDGDPNTGRVEVRDTKSSAWGTICDDLFDEKDAKVICKCLGKPYKNAIGHHEARYGSGSGDIHLDNLNCVGNENSIFECRHNGWGRHNCWHHEDASVECRHTPQPPPANGNHCKKCEHGTFSEFEDNQKCQVHKKCGAGYGHLVQKNNVDYSQINKECIKCPSGRYSKTNSNDELLALFKIGAIGYP